MSKKEVVMRNYELGVWDEGRVRDAVGRGWITAEEYKEITGKEYEKRG